MRSAFILSAVFQSGCLWALKFYIASCESKSYRPGEPGSWNVSLTLLEHSPPAYIDSRLVIEEVQSSPTSASTESPVAAPTVETPPPPTPAQSLPGDYLSRLSCVSNGKPTISIRLKCNNMQMKPQPNAPKDESTIFTPFQKSLMANSLQYEYVTLSVTTIC